MQLTVAVCLYRLKFSIKILVGDTMLTKLSTRNGIVNWSKYLICAPKQSVVNQHQGRTCTTATQLKLKGIVAAPLTPFDKSGCYKVSLKCHGSGDIKLTLVMSLVFAFLYFNTSVNGTVAEGLSMANVERKKVAEKWKEVADNNRLYVILHIGTGNLHDTQDLARHARDIGVDAIAALPTTYFKPSTEEQLVCYLEKIAEVVPDMPLLYYDYNITTGVYLNIPKMLKIAESRIPSLYGLKHTSPELTSALDCSQVCGGKYTVFFGTETLYLPSLSLGIPDVITTPVMGEYFNHIKQAFDSGDIHTAQKYQLEAQKLCNIILAQGGGIAGYKAAFKFLTGIDVGYPRLPLEPMSQEKEQHFKLDLQSNGFQVQI